MTTSLLDKVITKLRAGAFADLAVSRVGVANLTNISEFSDGILDGVYHIKSKVLGSDDMQGFGFSSGNGTLVVPYHLVGKSRITIDGVVYDPTIVNETADLTLFGGYSFTSATPKVGSYYLVKNPVLKMSITLKCVDITSGGVCMYERNGKAHDEPLAGWSGLPITDCNGLVYGVYSFHRKDLSGWTTRCFDGNSSRMRADWAKVVDAVLLRGFVEVIAGTGAGKTIGISKALIDKGVRSAVVLQPTRAMVENLYNSLSGYTRDIGYIHGEGQYNPHARFVVMTYGYYLSRIMARDIRPTVLFCDEVHTCAPEVQATLLFLDNRNSVKRIYATATPKGIVREHSGRFGITHAQFNLNSPRGLDMGDGVVLDYEELIKAGNDGLLIFVPTRTRANDAVNRLKAAYPTHKNIYACTSDTMPHVLSTGILTADGFKILVATNTLESGVTVKVKTVIDMGKVCYPSFIGDQYQWGVYDSTEYEASQRRGRVGRVCEGQYLRVHQRYSQYDEYARTFAQLSLYLKALDVPIPAGVHDKLLANPALSRLLNKHDQHIVRKILRYRVDPIYLLQNMDDTGRIWAKVARVFNLPVSGTCNNISFDDWENIPIGAQNLVGANNVKMPRFRTEDKYVDSMGNVSEHRHTSYLTGVAVGVLGLSYLLNRFMKRSFASYSAYMCCSWQEYIQMNYFEVKTGRVGGRQAAYISFTGALRPGAASLFAGFCDSMWKQPYEFQLRRMFVSSNTPQDFGVLDSFPDFMLYGKGFSPVKKVIDLSGIVKLPDALMIDKVRQTGIAEPSGFWLPPFKSFDYRSVCDTGDMLKFDPTMRTGGFMKYYFKIGIQKLAEIVPQFTRLKDRIVDSMETWVIETEVPTVNGIVDKALSFLRDQFHTVSFLRGALSIPATSLKNCVLSFGRGMIMGQMGLEISPIHFVGGIMMRSLFESGDRAFMGIAGGAALEFAGSIVPLAAKLVPDMFTPVTEFDVGVSTFVVLSGAALSGMSLVLDSGLFKMTPAIVTTASGASGGTSLAMTSFGFMFGVCLGVCSEWVDNRREARVAQMCNTKNSNMMADWLERSGRLLTGVTRVSLKFLCVSACMMVRPRLSAAALLGGCIFRSFSEDAFDMVLDVVPNIIMLSECLRTGSYFSMTWAVLGPSISMICVPNWFTYGASVGAVASAVSYTSDKKMEKVTFSDDVKVVANSASYSVAQEINSKFAFTGDVLIIGEGAGGLSQYYASHPAIGRVVSVCKQEHTLPSLTQVSKDNFVLIDSDVSQFCVSGCYDCMFIDISSSGDSKYRSALVRIVQQARPKRIVSSGFHGFDGYGVAYCLQVNSLTYMCLVRGHDAKQAPVVELSTGKGIEVYSPARNYEVPDNLPSLSGHSVRLNIAPKWSGPVLYSVGVTDINRGFELKNKLMVNTAILKTDIFSIIGPRVNYVTQSSRRLDDFVRAINDRVNVQPVRIRSALQAMLPDALELVMDVEHPYRSYTYEETLRTAVRTGSGGLTDRFQTMGEYIDSGAYRNMQFTKDDVIWSMVPKYENRKINKGEFPPPRVVTMSNLEFRLFSHQVLGMFNEVSPISESNGKMVFSDMMDRLVAEKDALEARYGERCIFYAGDVAVWDARPTVEHIRMLGRAFAKKHNDPEAVRRVFEQQEARFCVTACGDLVWKVGGVDSGSVTTKMGNDALNAARDLICVSVCVGLPLKETKKRIRRIVCGDDFIGVCPASWYDKLVKHYADVSKELGYPLKGDVMVGHLPSDMEFCSHYWIPVKAADKTYYMPYRHRLEVFERILCQPVHSTMSDRERAAQKMLSYLLLYAHDEAIRIYLMRHLRLLGEFDVEVNDSVKYALGLTIRLTHYNWSDVLRRYYEDHYGLKLGEFSSMINLRAKVNGLTMSEEIAFRNKITRLNARS